MTTIKFHSMADTISSFLGGALFGFIGAIKIWFLPLQISTGNMAADIAIDFGIKIIGTVILGTIGGLTGLATKDLYLIIKRKFKKK